MKKIFVFVLALMMLTGCASSAKPEGKKQLKVGTNAAFAPFEFVADNEKGIVGKFDGVDIALVKAIADEYGYDLVIEDMEFDSLGMALETGKVDMIAAGMTATEDRKKTMDFSEPYYTAIQYMIIRDDSVDTIKSAADLKGKSVGVQMATTGDFVCSDMEGVDVKSYKRGADAILALNNKQIDAVVIDMEPAKKFVKLYENLKIVEDPDTFAEEHYGMCVKKGNKETLDQINTILKKYIEEDKITELVNKYS